MHTDVTDVVGTRFESREGILVLAKQRSVLGVEVEGLAATHEVVRAVGRDPLAAFDRDHAD
jgi:hypothetical protein